jgi:NADH-quinone oxidoreductase subunit L
VFFLENAWIIPAIPVVSFWVILFFGKKLPKQGAEIGVAALAIAFALSCLTFAAWAQRDTIEAHVIEPGAHATAGGQAGEGSHGRPAPLAQEDHGEEAEHEAHRVTKPVVNKLFTWFNMGGTKVEFGTHIDGLAVTLLFVVTLISLLVHVFSTAYMETDRRKTHYFASLSLFTSGMLILITASNTLQMILGWEIMGLCSFMLIGHWWEESVNSDAALKAFFTTRTGDVGLLVGMSILFFAAGNTFEHDAINRAALDGTISHWALMAAAGALLCAVIGKSAQFPLHTWLPDAMAGPTPVSALIHAATMVVAGVFLVARMYGVFAEAYSIGEGGINPVAIVGGITIIIAAALAFVQADIKKVLAYSTVSQLGYMVMGLGVGAWMGAVFHIFTHAFFKAGLFLGAGSVSHGGSHHSFDMKKDMGGLKKHMPITFWTFLVCSLALAGFPLLAGFWSKDEILLGAGENGYQLFMVVGLVGAFMTACYMTRCVYLTFFGEARGNAAHHHPHESPPAITIPLIVLAVLAVGSGFLNAPGILLFTKWNLGEILVGTGIPEHEFSISTAGISVAVGLLGIAVGAAWYFRNLGPHGITARVKPLRAGYVFLENKYYLDVLYTDGVVGSIKGPIARAAYWTNQNVLDGVVNGVGVASRRIAQFVYDVLDQKVVDGAVNGAGFSAEEGGGLLRILQTGRVQNYAAIMFGVAAVSALGLAVIVTN